MSSNRDIQLRRPIDARFSYPIVFTHDLLALDNRCLRDVVADECPKLVAVYDSGLIQHHPELPGRLARYAQEHGLELVDESLEIPGGEASKAGLTVVERVIGLLDRHRLCRHAAVLAFGGGAVLDAVGLAASLVHRGVRLIRMPSTSLSQGDSAIGVKNGVNYLNQKNYLGTFQAPFAVLADLHWLRTLPRPILLDGLAEAVKVATIKDADFFHELHGSALAIGRNDWPSIERAVVRSAEIHLDHIAGGGDPFELGSARPLDFGHWAGHRLERISDFEVRHGEGVAIGIALDTCYATLTGLLSESDRDMIVDMLAALGLPIYHPLLEKTDDAGQPLVIAGLTEFREHLGGRLAITLPTGIGSAVEVDQMDLTKVQAAISQLRERNNASRQ